MQQQYLQTGQMPLFCSWLFDAMRQVGIRPRFSPPPFFFAEYKAQPMGGSFSVFKRPRGLL